MSNTAKLKTRGAELEAREQYHKAIEVYEQVLHTAQPSDELDVRLYNRVGDLHYRVGNMERAISYYEQAADLYADGGHFNNAIALCNKVLRHSPGRSIIYYKLGIISAKQGFNNDAKQNFLEYADRMQRIGRMDEAFRALKEFADLCPGQDDVRLMLADQLAKANRIPEALEQLELLYQTLESEGRSIEANATLERMKALNPAFVARRSPARGQRIRSGLVFLELESDEAAVIANAAHKAEAERNRSVAAPASDTNGVNALSSDDEFIDLREWIESTRTPASTRMVAHDDAPKDDQQRHFIEMLQEFKAGISRNVSDEDYASHYDLGIAFREMGLLEEAIGSFQKASRGTAQRMRASEAIGECFIERGQPEIAISVLERLLRDPSMSDSMLVGVLYLLGRAAESLARIEESASYFQRVLAVEIDFRDAAARLSSLACASR